MKQPNIILINCDDLGYGDLGCYGSSKNDTPALDRLAREGMRFTDFYMASPVCSASRSAMMTGSYSQRIGFGPHQVLFPGNPVGLRPGETTLASMLKDVGYATKMVGKWHCGDQPEFLPTRHGFDDYFGIPYSNDMGRQVNNMKGTPLPLMRNETPIQVQPDQRGITERYVDESCQFIRQHASGEQPFFLYLAHMYVHVPLFVPQQFLDASRNGAYGGAVAAIDWAMAAIDAELARLGLRDDTMIIFTSDNGSRASGEGGSNGPLKGTKAQTWEGGQRVPCIIRWPGQIPAGGTCEGIATAMDFMATFADISDARMPTDVTTDSISLAPVLLDNQPSSREWFAYYRGTHLEAIRWGDWKLHYCKIGWAPGINAIEEEVFDALYDLREDVGENHNLFDQHPEIVAEIHKIADEIRQQLGDSRLGIEASDVRPIGHVDHPQTLTTYDPDHPYMIAYYDLADMPTMSG